MKYLLPAFFACVTIAYAHAQIADSVVLGLDYKPVARFDHPLCFVNGKKFSADSLQYIDPKLIESIDVIKGLDAQARYGNEGKNGVLLFRLKDVARTKED